MNASELTYKTIDSSSLYEYYVSHCHKPTKIRTFNHITEQFEERSFPCGKCLHCRATRQNEWVSRLALETDAHAYSYFVTLTYQPVDDESLSINCDKSHVLSFWRSAFDLIHEKSILIDTTNNSVFRNIRRPSVLRIEDLQNFMKRLRKSVDFPIRFFAMGEYGEKHFHPHYHLILWSDSPLTADKIQDAWSYKFVDYNGVAVPFRGQDSQCVLVSLGNTDFHDLKANGTIAGTGNNGQYSLGFTLKYVSKYVTKNHFNDEGLRLAWQKLDSAVEDLPAEFNYSPADCKYLDGVAINWPSFVKKYRPKGVCSKRPLIGGQYLLAHFDRFKEGSTSLGECLGTKLIYPAAFERRVVKTLWPLRISAHVRKGEKHETRLYTISPAQFLRFFASFDSLSVVDPFLRAADLECAYTHFVRSIANDGLSRFSHLVRKKATEGGNEQEVDKLFSAECLAYAELVDVSNRMRFTFDAKSHGFIVEPLNPKDAASVVERKYIPDWLSLSQFCLTYCTLAETFLRRQLQRDNLRKYNEDCLKQAIEKNPAAFYDAEREALIMHKEIAEAFQQNYKIRHQSQEDNQ